MDRRKRVIEYLKWMTSPTIKRAPKLRQGEFALLNEALNLCFGYGQEAILQAIDIVETWADEQ